MKVYKIVVFVPVGNKEDLKEAMFNAGAGKIGSYDRCSFETVGTGQFRPLEGSNPHSGTRNKIEIVKEVRIEMVCEKKFLKQVINAIMTTHPYEMPAYNVTKCRKI